MKPPANAEPEPPKLTSTEFGEMLVNLADPSGAHYLRFTAVLEYPEEEEELALEIKEEKHILQHTVITLLRSKTLEDVKPPDSIEKVQREMTEAINKKLEHGKITRIYFTEYLTQ
ncbi:MAG: flagellar basal body-associated FliL family protein [Firmicutes bacterium]|nr:flagellar basal body-associated FliL family protein [Bacillota bacterium]